MAESDLKTFTESARQAAAIVQSQRALSALMPSPAMVEAARGLDNLKLANTSALAMAAKGFEGVRPLVAPQIAEAMRSYKSPLVGPEFAKALRVPEVRSISTELTQVQFATAVQPWLAESLKGLRVQSALVGDISAAMRNAAVLAQGLQIGSLAGEAVRRAAEFAENPSVGSVAEEAMATLDLEHASPKERRALQANVVGAIGMLASVAAVLVHNGRLDLAAPLIGLMGYLLAIHGQIRHK